MGIEDFSPRSGRVMRENGSIANDADGINADGSRNVVSVNRNMRQDFTIKNGQQISNNYVDLGGKALVALSMPAVISQTTLTFLSCDTPNGTYQDVYDSYGNLVVVQIGAGRVTALIGTALQAISALQYIKIKVSTPVTADRIIGVIAKG